MDGMPVVSRSNCNARQIMHPLEVQSNNLGEMKASGTAKKKRIPLLMVQSAPQFLHLQNNATGIYSLHSFFMNDQ